MADNIERVLRQVDRENPGSRDTSDQIRAIMWPAVVEKGFPRQAVLIDNEPSVYRHPLFDFVNSDARLAIGEDVVQLTLTENRLLIALCREINRAVSRESLLSAISTDPALDTDPKTVNVHIGHLRRKIANGREIDSPIETVKGIGYRLVDPTVPNGYGYSHPQPSLG
ncbi:MAG: winged helix-turn-helix domain-containing protein [Candidatus Levybacteria bacterium]|nr:winged helix-turn-helix domain-containing protein [Candidatus Levybacteria bacterium]